MIDWERCKGYLEAALEYNGGGYTIEDIAHEIATNRAQFWPGHKSAAVTQIIDNPQQRVLHIMLAGGDMAELKEMLVSAEEWGRNMGCQAVTLAGRKGWQKVFPDWDFLHVVMSKPL